MKPEIRNSKIEIQEPRLNGILYVLGCECALCQFPISSFQFLSLQVLALPLRRKERQRVRDDFKGGGKRSNQLPIQFEAENR